MLMGIVKKNGIMIVDFARQRVDAGEAADKAIHDASISGYLSRHRRSASYRHRRRHRRA
jgi:hypothetical protein